MVLFAKRSSWGDLAVSFIKLLVPDVVVYRGDHGDQFPSITEDEYDYIVSFSCPWVLPERLLCKARIAAINFHPGAPNYPGIGCTNFALYNGEHQFGVVCHHMSERVDAGNIILTKYFPIFSEDSVFSLTERTYHYLYALFMEIMDKLINHGNLPVSSEHWSRKPYTRKELNELCEISTIMSEEEIKKRVRAVTFPGKPGAYINLGGYRFLLDTSKLENHESIVMMESGQAGQND